VGPEVVVQLELIVTLRLKAAVPPEDFAEKADTDRGLSRLEPRSGQGFQLGQNVRVVGMELTESSFDRGHV
jgi:hypothetical protein